MKLLNQLLLAILGMVFLTGCKESTSILSLAGEWEFAIDSMDIGISKHWYTQSFPDKIKLPGTMDDAGYGIPNRLLPSISKPQILHLTRKHSYIGPAWYIREISVPSDWEGKNIELKLERVIWQTNVWIDGKEVDGEQESLDQYLGRIESAVIRTSLANCEGNISKAAKQLGIKRQTLQHKLKKYQL